MAGICYRKGYEKGLYFEIKCLEDVVASKEKRGVDATFEKDILKSYRKYSEKDYADRPAEIV